MLSNHYTHRVVRVQKCKHGSEKLLVLIGRNFICHRGLVLAGILSMSILSSITRTLHVLRGVFRLVCRRIGRSLVCPRIGGSLALCIPHRNDSASLLRCLSVRTSAPLSIPRRRRNCLSWETPRRTFDRWTCAVAHGLSTWCTWPMSALVGARCQCTRG